MLILAVLIKLRHPQCVSVCVGVCFCVTFGGDTDPIQVPGELLGDVGLPPGRKSHHDDHRGRVGELRHRRWETHAQKIGKESCYVFYVRMCVYVCYTAHSHRVGSASG